MNTSRKKELRTNWKNRRPEMGVLSICCAATGEEYLLLSTDTSVGFNRHRFQLSAKMHPNQALQRLWDTYGENGFEYRVVKVLDQEEPPEKPNEELEALLEECLAENPKARKI